MKKLSLLLLIMVMSVGFMVAQRTVSGTVVDEDNVPLIGANVIVKGTTVGAITDIDGSYVIEVPSGSDVLVLSYTGYTTQEIALGASNVVNVTLGSDTEVLDEVVVTAFGVERERKELGYAVTTVEGEELSKVRTSNVLENLSGRVAGVRINSSSGTAGGGANILIRGASSLGGGNQPLFIVDGAPLSNSAFAGTRNEIIGGGADVGNRAADINPDDIETISVLKGASAVALYGQRARDGVILITTKRAKGKSTTVEVNSSIRFASPFVLPEFQNDYASGDFGSYDADAFTNGWGPKLDTVGGQTFSQFPFNEETALVAQPDNVSDFFETGVTLVNNVAVSTRAGDSDIRLSYTNYDEKGIVPGNELNRHTLSLNAGTNFTEKFRARGTANYVRTEGLNRPRQGSNNPNRTIALIYGIPRTTDVGLLKNNLVDENGAVQALDGNGTSNNPYYVVENNPFNNQVDRLYGTASLEYDFTDWFTLMTRASTDFFTEGRRNITSKGTINALNGQFEDRNIYRRENNFDLLGTFKHEVNESIGLNALVGWNVNQIRQERTRILANDLVVAEVYNPANALSVNNQRFESVRRLYGGFFDLGLNFNEYLFVNVTGRNDWSSTLPTENNSYFYPGVSAALIFTEALGMDNGPLSFGKLRASYAAVGSDEAPYQLDFLFNPASSIFTQFVADNTFPWGGQSVFTGPDLLPAGTSLLPQNQVTLELGTELQFYRGRVGLDLTYYSTVTSDQILSVQVPQSTGFDAVRRNVGEISNKGIEALLTLVPVKTSKLEWDLMLNFTQNTQKVEKLAPGLDDLALTSGFSGLSIRASEGEEFGLWGNGWERNDDGDIIINQDTGLKEVGGRTRLGDIFPDYQLGINNVISFGNWTASALVDISSGGVMFSGTVGGLRGSGLVEETLFNDREAWVVDGVAEVTDMDGNVTYVPNEVPVQSAQQYWAHEGNSSNTEGSIFDASYVKLREVTLSYTLPSSLLGDSFVKGVSFGFEARNLWLIDSAVPHVDPEASFFGPSLSGGAANVEFWSVPSARSYGANVRLTF